MLDLLEQRVFMSASGIRADVLALQHQAAVLTADIPAWTKQGSLNLRRIRADFGRLNLLSTDRSLFAAYSTDGGAGLRKLSTDATANFRIISSEARALVIAVSQGNLHPNNPNFAAKADAERSALNTAATAVLAAIEADTANQMTSVTGDLNAISSASGGDSQTQTDVATAEAALTANANKVNTLASNIIADLNLIVSA